METCYAEVLAYLAPKTSLLDTDLRAFFPSAPGRPLGEIVAAEWADLYRIKPTTIVKSFRSDYTLFPLRLPDTGWLVDIEHPDTMSVLNSVFGEVLAAWDHERLTLGVLQSEERLITTELAGHIHDAVLFDGSLPHGIRYTSKHGYDGDCYAVWLRRIDDGFDESAEPTKPQPGEAILPPASNPPLKRVADRLGLDLN